MTNDTYKKVERYIINQFTEAGGKEGINHFLRTVHWVKILDPDADEALLIAAVAHDIERGFRNHAAYDKVKISDKGFRSDAHLAHHQQEGARIIGEYLQEIGADQGTIERVSMLVSSHEIGGNDDQNLLKDADSISFFETNVDYFVSKTVSEIGKEKVKDKFDWTFNRITSGKAKRFATPLYQEAIKKLGY
jgi:hypothetical protein